MTTDRTSLTSPQNPERELDGERASAVTPPPTRIQPLPQNLARALSDAQKSALNIPVQFERKLLQPLLSDSIKRLNNAYGDMLANSLQSLTSSIRSSFDLSGLIDSLTAAIDVLYKQLPALIMDFDLGGLRHAYKEWGRFGWIVPKDMPLRMVLGVPETRLEADRLCMAYYNPEKLTVLFEDLRSAAHKKKDLSEAIDLFEMRRYKPCAMMLCSLIDAELIRSGGKAQGKRERRGGKRTLGLLENKISKDDVRNLLIFENYLNAWNTFFQPGEDFARSREGELNRNFLAHGMMYKPVRRKSCIKLFVLLEATTRIAPILQN